MTMGACSSSDQENITPLPLVNVNFRINLTNLEYQPLQVVGGMVTIESEGVQGIIIYRESSLKYIAYEKLCPYDGGLDCHDVVPEASGFGFVDECCKSTFDLQGNPTGGPVERNLYSYNTAINGNFLFVTN